MKIGILTFFWSNDNYGQLLQCYALQKFLNDRGHEVFLINYDYRNDINKTPFLIKCLKALNVKKLFNYLKYKKNTNIILSEQQKNNRDFDLFRKKYLCFSKDKYTKFDDLKNNPPNADMYIVGSDQVWNFLLWNFYQAKNIIHAYLLDFGENKVKRISYAASWGITHLSDNFKREISPLLQKFDYVSVREESGIKLCNECGCKKVEWVPDPTMLIDINTYRSLYKENVVRKISKPFILVYLLNNTMNFKIEIIEEFAKKRNLEMIYVTGNGVVDKKNKFFATIPEWLYLVDNAEYIITNSFHCGVFSILFNKQFGIVKLDGKMKEMNSRFDSLFKRYQINERYISNNDLSILDDEYTITKINNEMSFDSYIK